ncbi:hypothetical protein IC762_30025 [Bradyrhizobium genosp. L]|nr:hypothetical protein IC762_30025 [Bradyrhizobium genosp. L]
MRMSRVCEGWNYWKDPSHANRDALRDFLKPEAVRDQYVHGAPNPTLVSLDGSNLDSFFLAVPRARPGSIR